MCAKFNLPPGAAARMTNDEGATLAASALHPADACFLSTSLLHSSFVIRHFASSAFLPGCGLGIKHGNDSVRPEGTLSTSRHAYLDGFLASAGIIRPNGGPAPAKSPEPPEPAASREPAVPPEPAPLSWEEQVKQTLHPFDAFPRLLACADTDQPPPADDRFRFRWFGLFYQGPDHDAFVLRLRLPGGRLKGFQWLGLAEIVQELAGGVVEPNAQGGLDLPGIPVRAGVEALRRVEAIGLSARGTGGDCVQAVRGGERETNAEPPRVYGLVCALEQALAQSREFGDLPGPCEVAFRAADEGEPVDGDAARLVFRATRPAASGTAGPAGWPRGEAAVAPTWEVSLPGGGELGVAFPATEVLPVCFALLRIWSRQADRTCREQAAWASFCARLGAGELRAALERELGKSLAPSTGSMGSTGQAEKPSPRTLPAGRLLSGQMVALARLAAQSGLDELRFVHPGGLLVPDGADPAAFEAVLRHVLVSEAPG